jgi:hypothetical protein
MSAATVLLREEGNAIVRNIARGESAKVVAFNTGITPRHVYNLREEIGQPDLAWPYFIMMAKQYPALRGKILEWLDAENGEIDRKPTDVLRELERILIAKDRTN